MVGSLLRGLVYLNDGMERGHLGHTQSSCVTRFRLNTHERTELLTPLPARSPSEHSSQVVPRHVRLALALRIVSRTRAAWRPVSKRIANAPPKAVHGGLHTVQLDPDPALPPPR